ncbi:putative small secreted protein [Actimicrobium sp. GrIS 1.19]|uniref:entericidin A/B family lipoprotein n=1 Tax=Actimicrobium sp. GrIS 1.19 TaxID=3071708 RepID=UPI002DFD85FD|nr:putative small secreted protein [Actimicrobium sp. GrIS 1.19]
MFKKFIGSALTVVFVVGLAGSFSGCNTVKGVGKDVEVGGEKLQDASDKAKK